VDLPTFVRERGIKLISVSHFYTGNRESIWEFQVPVRGRPEIVFIEAQSEFQAFCSIFTHVAERADI